MRPALAHALLPCCCGCLLMHSHSAHACTDHRGFHRAAFTPEQQLVLRQQILATPSANGVMIKRAALDLKAAIAEEERHHRHDLRAAAAPFAASNSFVRRFKQKHRLSSHRTKLVQVSKFHAEAAMRDHEDESLTYITECQSALLQYGPHLLLNMDETPCKLVDMPVTAIRETGSKEAAKIQVGSNQQYLNITTFPCISAAGDKLLLSAILKGKTERSLKKIREGASAAVNRVQLYYSESGWMNGGLLVRWLHDVVKPYTRGRPAALILDDFSAHYTDEVVAAAAALKIDLIRVPSFKGATSVLQPLDVQFNSLLKSKRTHLWTQHKQIHPDAKDSEQAAIERMQIAYQQITPEQTRAAFIKACIQL